MTNAMFNTVKPLPIICERTAKMNDKCGKTIDAGKLFTFNYFERIARKLSIQGKFFF
jgi:hypothetical protein